MNITLVFPSFFFEMAGLNKAKHSHNCQAKCCWAPQPTTKGHEDGCGCPQPPFNRLCCLSLKIPGHVSSLHTSSHLISKTQTYFHTEVHRSQKPGLVCWPEYGPGIPCEAYHLQSFIKLTRLLEHME